MIMRVKIYIQYCTIVKASIGGSNTSSMNKKQMSNLTCKTHLSTVQI